MVTKKELPTGIDLFQGKLRVRKRILGKDFCKYFDKLEDAERYLLYLKDKKTKVNLGVEIGFQEKTFRDFVTHFMRVRYREWSYGTLTVYNQILETALVEFGSKYMHQIYPDDISEYLHRLKEKRKWKAATFNRYHAFLNQLFIAAINQRPMRHCTDNPVKQVKRMVGESAPRVIFTTKEQMETFLSNAWSEVNPSYWIGVTILLNTGLRIGEAVALRRADVEFDHEKKAGRIMVNKAVNAKNGLEGPTKTKSHRVVYFSEHLYLALKFWFEYDSNALPSDHIIRWVGKRPRHSTVWPGKAVSISFFAKYHTDYLKKLGLPRVTIHGLRHSYATHTLSQTGNLRLLQSMLGHSDYETTLRYSQVLQDRLGATAGLSVGADVSKLNWDAKKVG